MPLFSRRPKSALPAGVMSALVDYGAAIVDARSGRPLDPTFGWEFIGPVVSALRGPEQDLVIQELYDAATMGANPFEIIGAYSLLSEWDPTSRDTRFLELQDAFLAYLHEQRYSSGHLTRYEADRWIEVHGDLRTSFDRIVEVDVPNAGTVAQLPELAVGENKLLALTEPLPNGNAFYAERQAEDRYIIFSERNRSSDDPTRVRSEETYLGKFSSMRDLYLALGNMFGTRPYWADESVDPYFPARRG